MEKERDREAREREQQRERARDRERRRERKKRENNSESAREATHTQYTDTHIYTSKVKLVYNRTVFDVCVVHVCGACVCMCTLKYAFTRVLCVYTSVYVVLCVLVQSALL
jgi:hypothetical protein